MREKYFINGLPELYRMLKRDGKEEKGKEYIVKFLQESFNIDLNDKVRRFLDIPGGIKPADMEYFKLYWELMQLYVNGFFYSTVVLSGVLSERICYDILSKQKIMIKDKECLSDEQISCLFKMNLIDIIKLLAEWSLIKEKTKLEMMKINQKRNSYVHPAKSGSMDVQRDSKEMVRRISKILENEFKVKTLFP
jgi:hypothetical protein